MKRTFGESVRAMSGNRKVSRFAKRQMLVHGVIKALSSTLGKILELNNFQNYVEINFEVSLYAH